MSQCPSPQALKELLADSAAELQLDSNVLAVHLDTCQVCGKTMDSLIASDSSFNDVIANLKRTTKENLKDEPALIGVVDRLRQKQRAPEPSITIDETPGPRSHIESTSLDGRCREVEGWDLSILTRASQEHSLGRLGHYEIVEKIGKGGFGMVLRGVDEKLKRSVAIKVLAPSIALDGNARKRFLREAQSAAAIRHENVVQIHAIEETPTPYLVMEFIPGENLQQRINRIGRLGVEETTRIGAQIALGLAAAHDVGRIHRDIKPSNILLEKGDDKVKIADFGLAKGVDDTFITAADDSRLTQVGAIAGTPMYMSPEQAEGRRLDHRSDLFSLGTVLYTSLCGASPFASQNPLSSLSRVVHDAPTPIRKLAPQTPRWLVEIVDKLLEKNPEKRFASAHDVAKSLQKHLPELQRVRDEPKNPDSVKPSPFATHSYVDVVPAPEAPRWKPNRTEPKSKSRWPSWLLFTTVIALAAMGISEWMGVTEFYAAVVRFFTPDGVLVLDVEDPDVTVTIDGEDVVVSGAKMATVRLKPGAYAVQANRPGKPPTKQLVEITKDCKVVLRISRETDPNPTADLSSDRKAAEWVLSLGGRIKIADTAGVELKMVGNSLPNTPFHLIEVSLLNNTKTTDAEISKLADCTALTYLNIAGTPLTDAGMSTFKNHSKLRVLYLDRTLVGDQGLAHFTNCKRLEHVGLYRSRVTDAGLAHLAGQELLTYLHLWDDNITEAGLKHLKASSNLRSLWLPGTEVTDGIVDVLSQFPALGYLNLENTNVSADAIAKVRALLPNCGITAPLNNKGQRAPFVSHSGLPLMFVPKGKAWLGGGPGKPGARQVDFPSHFFLGQTEITRDDWNRVFNAPVDENFRRPRKKDLTSDEKRPITNVGWTDIQKFLKILNESEHHHSGWTYRLPTNDEWEYACRNGAMRDQAESAFAYGLGSGSTEITLTQANLAGTNGAKQVLPVSSFMPNRLGLFDMHGNARELCMAPANAGAGPQFFSRGGSYLTATSKATAGFTENLPSDTKAEDLGFRVIRVRNP